jgi:hypothetical protein
MSEKKLTLKDQLSTLKKELDSLKNINKYIPPSYSPENVIDTKASRIFRYETDLKSWRNALDYAESVQNPSYVELVRLMNEIKDDAIICNAVDIRKSYVMSRDWSFKNSNDEDDEKATEFFNDYWFNEFISHVLDSIWYGYSLIKIGEIENDKLCSIDNIARQNVSPKLNRLLQNPFTLTSGFDFTDKNVSNWFILASDSSNFHYEGLFAKAAPYQVIHKVALLAQNNYVNKFGNPQIVIKTDINNERTVRQIEKYASNFCNDSYAIANLTDDIQLIEASGKSGEVYSTLEDRMENLIYKLILGSPLSNEQNFVGSADIRQNLTNLYSLKDIKYVEHYVNNELIPKLVNLGLKFLTGIKFSFDTTNKIDPSIQFNQLIQLINTGQFTVTPEYIEETFGIKISALASANTVFPDENKSIEDVPSI